MKNWNSLDPEEKRKIWKYLEEYFFNYILLKERIKQRYQYPTHDNVFTGKYVYPHILSQTIESTIHNLNEKFKYKSFAGRFLEERSLISACFDFYDIFQT
jgi:hypothetical protein